jgi:hypothetical protein
VIFGRTSALLLAMVTPYFFTYYLVTEQGRENTQPAEMWQKGGFLPHKSASTEAIDNPQAVNDFSSSPGVLRRVYIR